MKKKGIMLLMCLSLTSAALGFAACDKHQHTYDTSTWQSNETTHWHAATCKHSTEKGDLDGHADANHDGACDVCGYDGDHVHTYNVTAWEKDETGHWYASTCFHDVKKDFSAHTPDKFGVCTECDYQVSEPDVETVEKAVTFAFEQKANVKNGTITESNEWQNTTSDYTYGSDYFYVHTVTASEYYSMDTEEWYANDVNDKIYGVERNNTDKYVSRLTEFNDNITADYIKGFRFAGVLSNAIGDFYGAEELIKGLYDTGKIDLNKDFKESVTDGVYAFSYGYYEGDTLYVVDVTFTLDEICCLKTASVKVTTYSIWYDEVEEIPGDEVTYKPATGAEGTLSKNFTVVQNVEKVLENEYPADEVLVSEFTVVDADNQPVDDTITVYTGETKYLYLADIAPSTAILGLTEVKFSGQAIDNWQVFAEVGEDEDKNWAIKLSSYVVGQYEVTVAINGVENTYTVNVETSRPTSITAELYTEQTGTDWWGDTYTYYSPAKAPKTIDVYAGNSVVLGATVNKGTDKTYSVFVNTVDKSADMEELAWETGSGDDAESGYAYMLNVDTTMAGTYEIVFKANGNTDVTATVTVNVIARPDMKEVLNGTYTLANDDYDTYKVEFTAIDDPEDPSYIGGMMKVTYQVMEYDQAQNQEVLMRYEASYAYVWMVIDGVECFETMFINGYDFEEIVKVGENTDYDIVFNGNVLTKSTLAGTLVGTWNSYYNTSITFNDDGTGVFQTGEDFEIWDEATSSNVSVDATIYFTYTLNEENGTITIAQNANQENVGNVVEDYFTYASTLSIFEEWGAYKVQVVSGDYNYHDYSKPTVYSTLAHDMGYMLETDMPNNVYWGSFNDTEGVKDLYILANPGTYTVSVCAYGETTPITSLDQYYFLVNGVKVVGALTFEVTEAQRYGIDFVFVNPDGVFDIYVQYVPVEVEEPVVVETATVSEYDGIVMITDNLNSHGGAFEYLEKADGSIEFYKDGELDATTYVTYEEGVYKFKNASIADSAGAQVMIAQDGQTDISGMYSVSFVMSDAITLEFTKYIKPDGKVSVTDGVGAKEYNYRVTEDNSVVFYDGTTGVRDLSMGIRYDAVSSTFLFTNDAIVDGMMVANGEQTDISGTYTVTIVETSTTITITFTQGEFVVPEVSTGVEYNVTLDEFGEASVVFDGIALGEYVVTVTGLTNETLWFGYIGGEDGWYDDMTSTTDPAYTQTIEVVAGQTGLKFAIDGGEEGFAFTVTLTAVE